MNRRLVSLALAVPLSACGGGETPTSTPEPAAVPTVVVTSARWDAPQPVADAGERPFSRCSPYTQSQCRLFNQATAPAVAVNARGETVALWQRYEGDAYRLAGARLGPGGWTEAERLSPETAIGQQQVVIDGSGNALALWFGRAGPRMSRGAVTGGWSVPEDVEAGSPLVMEGSGAAHTLVTRWREGLFWRRLPPGGAWGEPVLLQAQGPTSQPFINDPRLAVTPGGVVHAVWVRHYQSSVREEEWNEVWSSRMRPSQAWTAPTLLARLPRAYAFSPTLAATDSMAVASYRHVDNESGRHEPSRIVEQHASGVPGATPAWSAPDAVSEPLPPQPSTRRPELPALAADARGAVTLAWTEVTYSPSERSRFEIRARRFSSVHGTWEHAQLIESKDGYLHGQFELHVAASAAGDAVVLWVEQKASDFGHRMWASVFVPGTGWSAPQALRDAQLMSEPALAMDGLGNAIVMWSEPEGDRTRIWSARLAATVVPAR